MTRDPHAVLGLRAGATADEAAAAYRALAKRWHPDRAPGPEAARRMAEINAAYDLVRAEQWVTDHGGPVTPQPPAPRARPAAGGWLPAAVRRALGREMLQALEDGEDVGLVTFASAWASPQALLAVTDRRLLWLLDDAPTHRVRSLRFRDVAEVEVASPRLRRSSVLRLRTTLGRRLSFSELRPATAAAIARTVRGQAAAEAETSSTRSATESTVREAR